MQIEEIVIQAERFLRIALTVLLSYFAALWIAAAWWTFQDIRSRTRDLFVRLAATLFVLAFNFPGLLIYVLLRPPRTLADLYAESLEEEALLRTLEEAALCPSCQEPIAVDFLYCPACSARLRQRCQRCERPILLRWRICPYCGTVPSVAPDGTSRHEAISAPRPAGRDVDPVREAPTPPMRR